MHLTKDEDELNYALQWLWKITAETWSFIFKREYYILSQKNNNNNNSNSNDNY